MMSGKSVNEVREGNDAASWVLRARPCTEHPGLIFAPHEGGRRTYRKYSRLNSVSTDKQGAMSILRLVGRGQHTTIPAWMSVGNRQPAHKPGGLQQQVSFGTESVPDHSLAAAETDQAG